VSDAAEMLLESLVFQKCFRSVSDPAKIGAIPDCLKSVWNPSDMRLTASEIIRWLSDIV